MIFQASSEIEKKDVLEEQDVNLILTIILKVIRNISDDFLIYLKFDF
jgi:hypothetical protein